MSTEKLSKQPNNTLKDLENQRSSRFPISTEGINKDDNLRQEEVFFEGETIR